MILGIDASNIRAGGGLTHLKAILSNASPGQFGFEKVVLWSSQSTLDTLPNLHWLDKQTHYLLNRGALFSFVFQIFFISRAVKKQNCAILFVPGGTFLGWFSPFVTMSQNMLPFEFEEAKRFGKLTLRLRFLLLFLLQSFTFKKAQGIIFLTNYALTYISKKINLTNKQKVIIPHGVSKDFLKEPKIQRNIKSYTQEKPFKLLYVSIVTAYKHQWNVAEAVLRLHEEGYPITLDLIGPSTKDSINKVKTILSSDSNKKQIVSYLGAVNHNELAEYYTKADGFIFASSCENMPIILIEAMIAGLPVVCSDKGPMPEVLGSYGVYFNPLDVDSTCRALKEFLEDETVREQNACNAFNNSKTYTWKDCSDSTFKYLADLYENTK